MHWLWIYFRKAISNHWSTKVPEPSNAGNRYFKTKQSCPPKHRCMCAYNQLVLKIEFDWFMKRILWCGTYYRYGLDLMTQETVSTSMFLHPTSLGQVPYHLFTAVFIPLSNQNPEYIPHSFKTSVDDKLSKRSMMTLYLLEINRLLKTAS